MRTLKYILLGSVLALSVASAFSAAASDNKYADYRAQVEATQGSTSSGTPVAWQHQDKYTRDLAEKAEMGVVVLNTFEKRTGPKNYRNNVTQ